MADRLSDSTDDQPRGAASSEPADRPTVFAHLDLDRQVGRSVWLAQADGEPVAARPATAAVFDDRAFERGTALGEVARYAAVSSSHLVPVLGVADRDDAVWLVSEYVEGVSLARLMSAATLTPVQAAYVAEAVLRALAELHHHGIAHGRLSADNVQVGTDGVVRLTDWALAGLARSRGFGEARLDDLANARSLLAQLAENADRPVVHHRGKHVGLLAALADSDPVDDAPGLAARTRLALLTAVGDETSMAVPRSELRRLVGVLACRTTPNGDSDGSRPSLPVPVPTMLPRGSLAETDRTAPPSRRRLRRLGVAAALVVALLGGGWFARAPALQILEGDGGPAATQTAPDQAEQDPSDTGRDRPSHEKRTPRPLPSFGPAAAGSITGVELRTLGSCRPGQGCTLQTTVRITPTGDSLSIIARLAVVERCTGKVQRFPAGSVVTEPGWSTAFLTTSVSLPDDGPLGVVAMTTAPVRAAAPPLWFPADRGHC